MTTATEVHRAVNNLLDQAYAFCELVFIAPPRLRKCISRWAAQCPEQVFCHFVPDENSLYAGLEAARRLAGGDFLGLIGPNDRLEPNAFAIVAEHLLTHHDTDVVYSDEDCIAAFGRRFGLRLKPDWSPESLLGFHYVGRLCLFRSDTLDAIGGFDARYDDAQEYDALLRISETNAKVRRIPKCLYHRRARRSPRPDFHTVGGAARHREAALRAHFARLGFESTVRTLPNGMQHPEWTLPEPPLVSVVIPTLNQLSVLKECVEGLRHKTDYPRKEIILVDTGSTSKEVFDYYDELTRAGVARIVDYTGEFNYSRACNLGARHARGDVLLFLNNDIEVLHADWLMEMVRLAVRPGVGCVGTQLFYPNGIVQHAGVVLGVHMAGLLYCGANRDLWNEFGSPGQYRNLLAIMGACQMLPRAAFDAVGGFDERYRIANSDVAIGLRLFRAGYRTVYTPHAPLVHHEGYTRGKTNPPEDIELTALDLLEMEIAEDPYFHPALSAHHGVPRLRAANEPGPREVLAAQIAELGHVPKFDSAVLDPYCDDSVRRCLADAATSLAFPTLPAAVAQPDRRDALRFALTLLRSSPSLRQRFPRALSEGPDGEYCRWLVAEGRSRFGWPALTEDLLKKVFADDPAARIRKIYAFRSDVQSLAPGLGLPATRGALLVWLVEKGKREYGLADEEIWWFLLESAEDPVAQLRHAYAMSSAWKSAFPEAMTDLGWPRFYRWAAPRFGLPGDPLAPPPFQSPLAPLEQLRIVYDNRPSWHDRFPKAFHDPRTLLALVDWLRAEGTSDERLWIERVHRAVAAGERLPLGVNVLGYFNCPSGLQTSVQSIVTSLRQTPIAVACHDVRVTYETDHPAAKTVPQHELHDVTLIHVQPDPYFQEAFRRANLRPERDRYRIAMWYWEFGELPEHWKKLAGRIDEFWAPTRFIADALERNFARPVVPMLPGVELGPVAPVSRDRFGIPEDKTFYLFMYDMRSSHERKNPLAIIEAYRRAFRHDDRVHLAIKVSRGSSNRKAYGELLDAAGRCGAQIIEANLSRDDANGLIAACDCYVSLHRSEGLGLTMAEAMLLGKPVIATAYSGNTDFMTFRDSRLVGYELKPLERDLPPYKKGWMWAEPSVDEAAHWMRWVHDHRDAARALGEDAKRSAESVLSHAAAARRLQQRLREIERIRSGQISEPEKKAVS